MTEPLTPAEWLLATASGWVALHPPEEYPPFIRHAAAAHRVDEIKAALELAVNPPLRVNAEAVTILAQTWRLAHDDNSLRARVEHALADVDLTSFDP